MTIKIVIRHAREDEKLLMELISHLKPLERAEYISVFHEGLIQSSKDYRYTIRMHMQQAHIILALVSHHFMASDASVEIEQALLYPKKVPAHIIPIIICPVDWPTGPLGNLKALPENDIPVKSWTNRDYAWAGIVKHIRTIVT